MQGLETGNPASAPATAELARDLSTVERELLQEVLSALRAIRYGSVVITLRDGRVVEIEKTERVREEFGEKGLAEIVDTKSAHPFREATAGNRGQSDQSAGGLQPENF